MLAASSHDRVAGIAMASACFHQCVLRKGAGTPAHDAVARLEAGDTVADRDDLAGAFSADGLPGAGLAVQAMAQHELTAVQRGGMHAHQELARPRLRERRVAQFEHGFRVGHLHPLGLHRLHSQGRHSAVSSRTSGSDARRQQAAVMARGLRLAKLRHDQRVELGFELLVRQRPLERADGVLDEHVHTPPVA